MLKKLIASTLLSIFLLVSLIVPYAHAQTWYMQTYDEWFKKVYDTTNQNEIFGERYTAAQVEWVMYGLQTFILKSSMGQKHFEYVICMFENNGNTLNCITQLINALPPGADNSINSPNSYAFKRDSAPSSSPFSLSSISGVGYLRERAAKLKLVQEVKAQGFGFEAASPIRQFWQAFRNLAYFLLVLVIIVMAFMIMFRVKLSPQTVITVQSALPGVVLTLIIITFSYAIAGFIVDLMYVVIGLIATVFKESSLFNAAGDPTWTQMFNDLAGLDKSIFSLLLSYLLWFIVAALGFILNLDFLSFFMAIIMLVIAVIVVIVLLFKITWMLLKNFFILLMTIAAGPLIILGGLLGFGGFTTWLKSLASILAIYAIVGPMFALAFFFLANAAPDGAIAEVIVQVGASVMPFTPNPNVLKGSIWTPPFLGGQNVNFLWLVASLAILTIIPKIGDIIKGALSGRPYPIGTGIGEAFGAPVGLAGFGAAGGLGYVGGRIANRFKGTWAEGAIKESTQALQRWTASGFRR